MLSVSSPSGVTLFTAPWVVPVSSPVIGDGAVAVAGGRIAAVGPLSALRANFAGAREEQCQGVLLPGLVNAHIHLELSVYSHLPQPRPEESFCDWIRHLLRLRQGGQASPEAVARAAQKMLRLQQESGVLLLLDTGNIFPSPCGNPAALLECVPLLELLGPSRSAEEQALLRLNALPDTVVATAHALYSTTAGILTAVKQRANRLGHIFSLHVAESPDELDFLRGQGGCFPDFLRERGVMEQEQPCSGTIFQGALEYLDSLGLLDASTLCVHCVQIRKDEIALLAARGAKVCLCAGSNRFLGVGAAPLTTMLAAGLLPALGTDSLASNEELDLWREMRVLREDHPGVEPWQILAMATLGGAQALGREQEYGSLAPGRKGVFLQVQSPLLSQTSDEAALLDALTAGGRPEAVRLVGAV